MKSLYQYSDYRSYLKDLIEFRREKGLPVSNRWFSQKMGINSNAWLTYILQGKRNLNNDTMRQLISILKFNVTEGRFVLSNVAQGQYLLLLYSDTKIPATTQIETIKIIAIKSDTTIQVQW